MSETSKTSLAFSLALLAAALTAAYVIVGLTRENRQLREQLQSMQGSPLDVSYAAGDALPAVSLQGADDSRTLDSLYEQGGVAVFLTTTCPYCLQTLPTWSELASDLRASGVPFHGVSFHSAELTQAYVGEHAIEWPVWAASDASVASRIRVASVPFTVLLGPGAIVRQVWLGPLGTEAAAELRALALAAVTP